jgi:hypothetical protein
LINEFGGEDNSESNKKERTKIKSKGRRFSTHK